MWEPQVFHLCIKTRLGLYNYIIKSWSYLNLYLSIISINEGKFSNHITEFSTPTGLTYLSEDDRHHKTKYSYLKKYYEIESYKILSSLMMKEW